MNVWKNGFKALRCVKIFLKLSFLSLSLSPLLNSFYLYVSAGTQIILLKIASLDGANPQDMAFDLLPLRGQVG